IPHIPDPVPVLPEPLWHIPAPARIPGKRPARPEPGGKDSPNRLAKQEPPHPSPSSLSSSASSEAEPDSGDSQNSRKGSRGPWNSQKSSKDSAPGKSGNSALPEVFQATRPLGASQISAPAPKSGFSERPGRAKGAAPGWRRPDEPPEHKSQVNVFGQPRLRASLRDLRSPRRLPKSSIEDDLKRLILMDNSCPEPEPAPALPRTLSDESLCGGRGPSPTPRREIPKDFPGSAGSGTRTLPGRSGHHGTGKTGAVGRLEPGLIPLPDTAGLEW
ncbi:SI1L3 protein, partial [Poecile atricapillus]|nr:SI1L3 protein [Poecile atricapillus]